MKKLQLKIINPVPDVNLFAVSLIVHGFQQPRLKPYVGMNFSATYSAFENGFLNWYVHFPLWKSFGKAFFNRVMKSRKFSRFLYTEHKRLGKRLYSQTEQLQRLGIRKLTDSQLQQWFRNLVKGFHDICLWGGGIAATDLENNYLTDWLERRISALAMAHTVTVTVPELCSVLFTPRELIFSQQEKDDLLRLAGHTSVREADIQNHASRYFWTEYGYVGNIHPISYYRRRIIEMRRKKQTPSQQLAVIKNERLKIKRLQAQYLQLLQADNQTQYLIDVAQQFMYLKLYRKEIMFKTYAALNLLLKEIGQRYKYKLGELQYCLPQEIEGLFKGTIIDKKIIKKRKSSLFINAYIHGRDSFIYGNAARKFIRDNLYHELLQKNIREISGMPAFLGMAKGSVRIINEVADMHKMKKGDVLVSVATSPNILPAMVKASAFVTDTGGITCHAAIVSRELKIPCVIGTKIATKVFKEGGRVEVDATKGIVRKL